MKFRRALVMGGGAVGGYFGGRIAERTPCKVTLIVRGDHLKAIREQGLRIESPDGNTCLKLEATDDPRRAGEPDLILFTVKSHDTDSAIKQIAPVVGDNTQILTLQNGIENYGKLEETFGRHRVIQGFCRIGAGVIEPGLIRHHGLGTVVAGEQDGSVTERLEALREIFEGAGIEFFVADDIRHQVWKKFAWNCLFNMMTALAEVTVDELLADEKAEALCHALFGELRAVAATQGIQLTREDENQIIEGAKKLENFKTSTQRDREKGKRLEYEAFCGAVVRLAGANGVDVPHNETLYALYRLIDQKQRLNSKS